MPESATHQADEERTMAHLFPSRVAFLFGSEPATGVFASDLHMEMEHEPDFPL
jgi:hypothetical protein